LPYVLKQCEGHFNSFVIYDVGSTDSTRRVIDWFYERNKDTSHVVVRKVPHVLPIVQGAFRNSMIAEGNRNIYMILDGDELYTQDDLALISDAANNLHVANHQNSKKKYGVFDRVEVTPDLTQQYIERRTHHRLYTRDAWWTGTHPGERAFYKQNHKSELDCRDITVWHMHNTTRSSRDADATKRMIRKQQKTYHPGDDLEALSLIKELPMLAAPIEDFKVSDALAALQEAELC
jgi:hypothetical protein